MSLSRAVLLSVLLLTSGAGGANGEPPATPLRRLDAVSPRERLDYLRRATVWRRTPVSGMDLLAGPAGADAFSFDQHVTCEYAFERPSGATPKFHCDVGGADVVKVKYGHRNGEVYAEVVSTRLFWALGFGADRMYPIGVTCLHCPIEPWWWYTERRVPQKSWDMAVAERRLAGKKIESREGQGWAWSELDLVDEQAGGSPRAQRDALKLLMVFIQNSDTKAGNQRLVCRTEGLHTDALGNESCAEPFLYVSDLGVSFGKATLLDTSKIDLHAWQREPVWKEPRACVGNLRKSLRGTLKHPRISEAGRRFLADLLVQLSDRQITDLFTAARVERHPRARPLADWLRVFKEKRAQIVDRRCPE